MSRPLLTIRNLAIAFGQDRVVEGLDLDIEAGGCVGIVGESGSGKTVTALSILRLIPEPPGRVVSGTIEFDGIDLLALPPARLADVRGRDIAMIFQEPMSSLHPVMTIGTQIEEALILHQRMDRRARRERVIEVLKLVGIPDPENRLQAYPHQFSGGMRQRVMIAMGLACNPRLLVADEPTTALDVTIQAQVLDLLKRLRHTLGTAVLIISHDMGVIAELADRVVVMYAGRVVEHGDVRAIFRNPLHPYTRGLLESIPRLDDDRRRLHQIPGSVPSPGTIGTGCPFNSRCSLRIERCRDFMPPMVRNEPGHAAACWVTVEQPKVVAAAKGGA